MCCSYVASARKSRHSRCALDFNYFSYAYPSLDGWFICLLCIERFRVARDLSKHYWVEHNRRDLKKIGYRAELLKKDKHIDSSKFKYCASKFGVPSHYMPSLNSLIVPEGFKRLIDSCEKDQMQGFLTEKYCVDVAFAHPEDRRWYANEYK